MKNSTTSAESSAEPSQEPILAFAAPFAVFLLLTQLETLASLKPYYPWVYAAKIACVVGVSIYVGRQWPAWSSRGLLLGVVFGVVGVVAWVAIALPGYERSLAEGLRLESWIPERVGYNPFEKLDRPSAWAFLAVRFIGLAVVVPIIEELFWRGFLIRYLIDERFSRVPMGTFTFFSFAVVTLLFAVVHPEILAAIVWGVGINGLLYQTRNLWACVVGHGVTNFLLGVYVLQSGHWELW